MSSSHPQVSSFTAKNIKETIDTSAFLLNEHIREICLVCGKSGYDHADDVILAVDTFKDNNRYYIIFASHKSCKNMFELNPLGYIHD